MNAYEKLEMLVKARGKKDITKLIRKRVVDKNGHSRYVYVKREDMEKVEKRKKGETEETMPVRPSILEGYIKWYYKNDRDVSAKFSSEDEFKEYVVEFLKNREKYTTKKEAGPKSTRTRGKDKGQRKERSDKGQKRVFDPEKMALVAKFFGPGTLDIISGIDKKARAMAAELGLSGDKAEKLVTAFHAKPPSHGWSPKKFTANWAEFEKTPEYQAIMEGQDTGGLTEDQKGVVSRVTDRYKDLITREYGMQKDDTRMDELATALEKFDRDRKAPDAGNMMENWEAFKKTPEFKKIVTGQDTVAPKAKEAAAEEKPKGKKAPAPKFGKAISAKDIKPGDFVEDPAGDRLVTGVHNPFLENNEGGRMWQDYAMSSGFFVSHGVITNGRIVFEGKGKDVMRKSILEDGSKIKTSKSMSIMLLSEIESIRKRGLTGSDKKKALQKVIDEILKTAPAKKAFDNYENDKTQYPDSTYDRIQEIVDAVTSMGVKRESEGDVLPVIGHTVTERQNIPITLLRDADGGVVNILSEYYTVIRKNFPDATLIKKPGGNVITIFSDGERIGAIKAFDYKFTDKAIESSIMDRAKRVIPNRKRIDFDLDSAAAEGRAFDAKKMMEEEADKKIGDVQRQVDDIADGIKNPSIDDIMSRSGGPKISSNPAKNFSKKVMDDDQRQYLQWTQDGVDQKAFTDGRILILGDKALDVYKENERVISARMKNRGGDFSDWQKEQGEQKLPNIKQVIPGGINKETYELQPDSGFVELGEPKELVPEKGMDGMNGAVVLPIDRGAGDGEDYSVGIDSMYYASFRKMFPNAKFMQSKDASSLSAVSVIDGGKLVGLIMPRKL